MKPETTRAERLEQVARMASEAWQRLDQMYSEQDTYRKAGRGVPSLPRDKFESYIDALTQDAKEALNV